MSALFSAPPVALTIAGSDCSSGAGIQADLKTFTEHGVYGLTAVTCVVSEIPNRVNFIQAVEPRIIEDQARLLLASYPVAAVKTGMLYNEEIIRLTARAVADLPAERRPRLVVDPVMVATSGDLLMQPDAVAAYQELLFPLAAVITPNMDEAAVLTGGELKTLDDLHAAADRLRERFGCAVLLKGGHLDTPEAMDVLRDDEGFVVFSAPRVRGVSTHGTGCTFSAAIASGLAQGKTLREAVRQAKQYITAAIERSFRWGEPGAEVDALNHFPGR